MQIPARSSTASRACEEAAARWLQQLSGDLLACWSQVGCRRILRSPHPVLSVPIDVCLSVSRRRSHLRWEQGAAANACIPPSRLPSLKHQDAGRHDRLLLCPAAMARASLSRCTCRLSVEVFPVGCMPSWQRGVLGSTPRGGSYMTLRPGRRHLPCCASSTCRRARCGYAGGSAWLVSSRGRERASAALRCGSVGVLGALRRVTPPGATNAPPSCLSAARCVCQLVMIAACCRLGRHTVRSLPLLPAPVFLTWCSRTSDCRQGRRGVVVLHGAHVLRVRWLSFRGSFAYRCLGPSRVPVPRVRRVRTDGRLPRTEQVSGPLRSIPPCSCRTQIATWCSMTGPGASSPGAGLQGVGADRSDARQC